MLGMRGLKSNDELDNDKFGRDVRYSLDGLGGVNSLQRQCDTFSVYHHNNYLPQMWDIHAKNRIVLFRLLDLIKIKAASQDDTLIRALAFVIQNRNDRRDFISIDINLGFASDRWQNFIISRKNKSLAETTWKQCPIKL